MSLANYQNDDLPEAGGRPALAARGRSSPLLLLRLAFADLWHERMLTACVVVALTAVIAPLLILLSLKYGLVETLRMRLIDDPRNRELRPQSSHFFTDAEIQDLRSRPDVTFVIPLLSSFSTNVKVSLDGGSAERVESELLPTMPGDPLLEDNGTQVPALTQCVLSQPLYHRLSSNGDPIGRIHLHISRIVDRRFEEVTVPLDVIGAVSERATAKETIFVQLQLLEEIENYLQGMPVPRLGWEGEVKGIDAVVEQVAFSLPRVLEPEEEFKIKATTAFSNLKLIPPEDLSQYIDSAPAAGKFYYLLSISTERKDNPAGPEDIERLRNTLPTTAGDLLGLCLPMQVLEVTYPDGKPLPKEIFQVKAEVVSEAAKKAVFPLPPIVNAPKTKPTDTAKEATPTKPMSNKPPGQVENGTTEVVVPAVPVKVMPDGSTRILPSPTAPLPTAPSAPVLPRVVVPSQPNLNMGGTPSFQLDGKVGPLTRPPPPPAPKPTESKGKAGEKDEPSSKPDSSGKKRIRADKAPTSWQRFSDEGGRYVLAAAGSAPRNSDASISENEPDNYLPRTLLLPESWGAKDGQMVAATLNTPSGPVHFTAAVQTHSGSRPLIPQSLAGVLRAAMDKPVKFDADLQAFIPTSTAWPSFRMVVRDIDSVQGVVDYFHDQGMNVITKAERIRDVKELDYYTNRVFWLIAAVGLTGAVGALLASLIAAVERKRRSLGVLRLLGMRRRSLLRLPFYQSAVIVSLSVGLAIAAWHWVSKAITTFTLRYLEAGEALQTLPPSYLLYLWGGSLAIAAFASLIAGIRVMGVDPSEAIRDE